jgi:choline dehydrogenase-like flavoprotein
VTLSYSDNDKRLIRHALQQMHECLDAGGARDLFDQNNDTCHLHGTARMGDDPRTSVVNGDCRSWDIPISGYATARYFRPSAASTRH